MAKTKRKSKRKSKSKIDVGNAQTVAIIAVIALIALVVVFTAPQTAEFSRPLRMKLYTPQPVPTPEPTKVTKQAWLTIDDVLSLNSKNIELMNVGSNGAVVVDVNGVSETVTGTETVNGVEITVDDYEYYNSDGTSARHTLYVDQTVNHDLKEVKLLNVGSNGAVVVEVDGVSETIQESEVVEGLPIAVKDYHYDSTRANRYATLLLGKSAKLTASTYVQETAAPLFKTYTINDWPRPFVGDSSTDVSDTSSIIVGSNAPTRHVIIMTEIATYLQNNIEEDFQVIGRLDSEVSWGISDHLIVIGTSSTNSVTRYALSSHWYQKAEPIRPSVANELIIMQNPYNPAKTMLIFNTDDPARIKMLFEQLKNK